ncbi:MAG: class I SAM-dependent methyltransferase [Thermoleophilaceae bacterium]|nr:class I SAM-dependent methyltransferase [Thermoleophilaceae bacterium]
MGSKRAVLPDAEVYLPLEQQTSSSNTPRWGHGAPNHPFIEEILAEQADSYRETLDLLRRYGRELSAIDRGPGADLEPRWDNQTMWGLDGAAIYCLLRSRSPRRYLEIGSGESTKFAARAKRDGQLETAIISIDPLPRSGIDALCDEPVRCGLEHARLSTFEGFEAGDVVFLDGSHRVFMNNDVSVFFLDVLPRLPPGVLVGVHDIFLPEDYGPDAARLYWSEAYMVGLALLVGRERLRPVFAAHYVSLRADLRRLRDEVFEAVGLGEVFNYGSTLWFEVY